MNINFKNKTLLISGGYGDFGKIIINKFCAYGANVIITTTNKKKIQNNKKIKALYLDFTLKESVASFTKEIKKIKKIDFLINNAGINIIDKINNIKKLDIFKIVNVNLEGPIWLSHLISKKMIKYNFGRIINISSIYGVVGKQKRSLYSSTKFGLIGLTKSSALDLAKNNILVNSISPGIFKTKLTKKILGKAGMTKARSAIPLGKLGNPEDLANLCLFLCSTYNQYITGENIVVDGGYTAA
jgi:3-oxoacyl-[acyl-carrier protein] reductase